MPPPYFSPSGQGRRAGFALLVTITLVAFLVLILVSLAAFTRVETQVASNSQQLSVARQNALTALNVALGELQKYAGPDQRATAGADIVTATPATGTRHWTGVWGNAANPQSDLSSAPALLQWLVSGNESTSFNPVSHMSTAADAFGQITTAPSSWSYTPSGSTNITSSNVVLLVGPNTAEDQDNHVIAPLETIEIPPANVPGANTTGGDVSIGKYAWWVGDEGVKARVNVVDPYVLPTARMEAAGLAPQPSSLFRLMAPQRAGVENVAGFGSFPLNTEASRSVLNLEQASFASASITPEIRRNRFHDLTTVSSGVIVDQLRGGLARDLTYAFGRANLSEFRTALALPNTGATNPLIRTAVMPASEGRVPTWEQLRSFARLDGSNPVPARAQTATDHGIYPVLSQARIGVGGQIVADGANSHFLLRMSPSVVLANPYNATITADVYRVRVDFGADSHLSAYTGGSTQSFWRMPLRRLLEGQQFEIRNLTLAPGEARVFTLATDNTPWAATETHVLENDWSDFAIQLDTRNHDGSVFDETVPFPYPNPSNPAVNLPAKGVHLVFGDGRPTGSNPTANWGSTAAGPNLTSTSGGDQRGGTLSWALLDGNDVVLQRIETLGYATNSASMYGIRGETIQNSGSSIIRMADAGSFSTTLVHPYYAQFNWRAPLASRTSHHVNRGFQNPVMWTVAFHQGTSADPTLERWIIRKQTTPPFTHVEWNGVVGTQNPRPLAQDNWRPFDIPRSPTGLVSIGQLQHFNAGGHYDITYPAPASPLTSRPAAPTAQGTRFLAGSHAIGNSRANPHIAADSVKETLASQPYYDASYLLNRDLFDGNFFSGYPQSGPEDLATARLPNARLQPFRDSVATNDTAAFRGPDTGFNTNDVRLAARNLMLSGAFNVNSTSVEAWTAVLSALGGTEFNGESGLAAPFPRSIHQPGGKNGADTGSTANAWNGFRDLTPTQITDLADKIVTEIRSRGPFVSLADFVNRSLTSSTPAHTYAGALQAAIDQTDINANFITSIVNSGGTALNIPTPAGSSATLPYPHTEHLPKHGLEGIAGWLSQADLLQALAPMLSARSDTFRIRTYGEVLNPSTGVRDGRAWCEAIVQRLPDYVVSTGGDDAIRPVTALSAEENRRFGRRFVVVDFRWLSPEDI